MQGVLYGENIELSKKINKLEIERRREREELQKEIETLKDKNRKLKEKAEQLEGQVASEVYLYYHN